LEERRSLLSAQMTKAEECRRSGRLQGDEEICFYQFSTENPGMRRKYPECGP